MPWRGRYDVAGQIGVARPRLGHVDVELVIHFTYYVRHGGTEHWDLKIRNPEVARGLTMNVIIVGDLSLIHI